MTEPFTLSESNVIETRLLKNLEAKYYENSMRDGTHVSDLTLCIRQAVFRRLDPKPPTPLQMSFFIDGARKHQTLQELYGNAVSEYAGEYQGVKFHIDLLDNAPIELKTTRSNMLGKRVSPHYIRQLLYYMLAVKSGVGFLQMYLINAKKDTDVIFPAYKIEMLDAIEVGNQFLARRNSFMSALHFQKPEVAMSVWRTDEAWACRNCPYYSKCEKIEK